MGQRHAAAFKFKMRWEQLENETTTRRRDFIAPQPYAQTSCCYTPLIPLFAIMEIIIRANQAISSYKLH